MEIKINTDGTFEGTQIELDGTKLSKVSKFNFSLRVDENGIKRPPKLQALFIGGSLPMSLYGSDFSELENKGRN